VKSSDDVLGDTPLPRPPNTKRWIWLIVAILLAAFAGVGGVQWRQLRLLNSTVLYDSDNIVWSFYQVEHELTRLRHALADAARDPVHMDREALQLRYDVFVSRLPQIDPERTAPHFPSAPIQTDMVARLRAFVADADPYFGPNPTQTPDAAGLRWLGGRLELMSQPVHDLALWGNESVGEQAAARNTAVRQQNRIALGLALFQALLTIVFALIAVRQLRALETRGQALEQLAHRLRGARNDAEAASRTKTAFLANMSHELRTPFQGVLGMLALLRHGPLTPPQSAQLRIATESANHLLGLLNDVLDASTLEGGHLRLFPQPTSLARLLDEVESVMSSSAHDKGLELKVIRATGVPNTVEADAKRLKQILFNLMSNAVKFTDHGTVTLKISVGAGTEPRPLLLFEVSDTGIGMDRTTIGRLFQRFSQGDDSTSRRFGGTGLGLEISRSIAQLMGGDIDVVSSPGSGSCFTLRVALPARAPEAPPTPALVLQLSHTPALRVLVVDDHPANRDYMQALLTHFGHAVTLRTSGSEAVNAVRDDVFDIVLMDLHMPLMDGFDATRAIRALPAPAGRVPIVALTADAFRETREAAKRIGMNDFLAKPVQPFDLAECLARFFAAPTPPAPTPPDPAAWIDATRADAVFSALAPGLHSKVLACFFDDDESGAVGMLLSCLASTDQTRAHSAAHAARGAASNLGLTRLAETMQTIEALDAMSFAARAAELRARVLREVSATHDACIRAGWIAPPAPRPA
jgi:signal transduction histidine kinase/FixJ family two-component response regulator/HPt (histidine-containing phosphotransfer) domain-containing protein